MNKIFLFLLTAIYLFGNINENKIDLYFGNGINTDFKSANFITKKLNEILLGRNLALRDTFFEKDLIDSTFNIYKYNTNLAYNNTFGILFDFIEAADQKNLPLCYIVGSSDSLQEKINLSDLPIEEKNKFIISLVNGDTVCSVLDSIQNYDLTKQINSYKESIDKGHRVMAVVHSQGNLFLNEVGERLEDWEKYYIEAYGIATPAFNVFKPNDEDRLNNYITLDQDPISLLIALNDNYSLTSEEISKYNITTMYAEGHYIDNYLRVPSTRDIIVKGIEGKSKKLLNLPSLFEFTKSNNYCSFLTITHKYKKEKFYQGLIFNENGKVNSVGQYVIMNNNFLEGFTELPNDPINCYSDSKSIDFIKRDNTDLNLDFSIYNITNKGYIISGEINNYESNKTYKGVLENSDTGEIIESLTFTKLQNNTFEVSFPMKTKGNFYFKLKTIEKLIINKQITEESILKFSNEVFLTIEEISLNDNLNVTTKSNSILVNDFFDQNAINYKIRFIEKQSGQELLVKELKDITINSKETLIVSKKGLYTVDLIKTNSIGESVILTKYIEVLYDNPEDYFFKKVEITNPERDFYQNTFYGYLNVEAQNLETGMKIYATKEGGLKEALAGSIVKKQLGYSFKNGHIFKYEVTIEDIDKKIVARKYIEKMIDEELKFYYTPTVQLLENCKDIDNSGFRINNGNALNENLYVVKANGQTLLESIDLKDIFGVNLSELNTVDIVLKNTITGKEFSYPINISFTAENTICRSTLREMRQAVAYTIEKDSTGKIIKVGYTTTYQPGEGVPGKIEFFLNGELKTTYAGDQVKELINTPAKEIFPVDSSKQVKITMKVYDMYGVNIIKIYDKYFVY